MEIHICSITEYDANTRVPTIVNPNSSTFYLVPTEDGTSPDLFTEWVYVNNAWEMFGNTTVDLSGYLTDVQINGSSIVNNNVADIPLATATTAGVVKVDPYAGTGYGGIVALDNKLYVVGAPFSNIKYGGDYSKPVVAANQHAATFYGLAKAAGADEKNSTLAFGTYSDNAKSSIQNMLGITDKYSPKEWVAESETELVTNAHNIGDLFYIGETLYKVIADLNAGDAINVGVNVEEVNVNDILDDYATKEDVQDNVNIVEKSASGSIANFSDGADNIPLKSLVVNIDPVQDLHGYDSPWVGGAGKNLFNKEDYEYKKYLSQNTGNINTSTGNPTWNTSGYIKVTPGTTYVTSPWTVTSASEWCFYDADKVFISGKSDKTRTATAPENAAYVRVDFPDTVLDTFQLEKGTTASAYAPYENICPISGWTEVQTNISGINVWDEEWVNGYINDSGVFTARNDIVGTKNAVPVKPNTTYRLVRPNQMFVTFWKKAEAYNELVPTDFISRVNFPVSVATFTTPDNCYAVHFNILASYGNTYNHDISVNYPSTDNDYHPYTGRSITIDLDQTVYGSKLDVLSGVLRVTHQVKTFDGSEDWSLIGTNKFYVNKSLNDFDVYDVGWFSDKYSYGGYRGLSSNMDIDHSFYTNHNNSVTLQDRIFVFDSSFADVEAFKSSLVANPLTVYGMLKEPIEVQLEPHEVKSLLGANNIFADTGDTSVEYFSQVDEDLVDYIKANLNLYAKKDLLNNYVDDIQIDGTSIVENGIAEIPFATSNAGGVVKIDSSLGIKLNDTNKLLINRATTTQTKAGLDAARPIVPICQHESVFYGLAKASGDTTQASSSNAVGTYTESAKSAISDMLNGTVQVSGTDPTIIAKSGIRYVCGEVLSLDFTPSVSGICDVVFISGSTPTVLTVPNTVKWANGFDPAILEANATYEINIMDGYLGVVGKWT